MHVKDIAKLIPNNNPVVLEVGTHRGEDAEIFLSLFNEITLYCFEPDPRCIQHFKSKQFDSRCRLIEAAVSNKNGSTVLHLSGGTPELSSLRWLLEIPGLNFLLNQLPYFRGNQWDASSSIKDPVTQCRQYPWLRFDKKIEVLTVRLDTWLRENKIESVDFIWSDVQGAESELIEGLGEEIQRVQYIYMEYGEVSVYPQALTRGQTVSLMEARGFALVPEYSDASPTSNLLFKKISSASNQ